MNYIFNSDDSKEVLRVRQTITVLRSFYSMFEELKLLFFCLFVCLFYFLYTLFVFHFPNFRSSCNKPLSMALLRSTMIEACFSRVK